MNDLADLNKRELGKLGFGQGYVDATGFNPRSVMAAPLFKAEGTLLGVVQVIDSTSASGVFDERDEEAFVRLASHGAIAIANIEVTKQAMKKWVCWVRVRVEVGVGGIGGWEGGGGGQRHRERKK